MTRSLVGTTRSVVYIGYLVAFILLGGTVAVIVRGQERYNESMGWTDHSYDVLDGASQLLTTMQRAEGSARVYVINFL